MCGKPPTHGFRTLSHSDRVCRAGLAAWRAFLSTILRAVGNHLISDAAAAQAVWVEDAIFGRLPPSWGSHVLGLSAYATEIGRSLVPAHKGPRVEQLIKAAGAELRYLPAYSPDMNPIEKAFSKLKAFLRKLAEPTVAGLILALETCAEIFKPSECINYFKSCGYQDDTG